MCYNAALQVSIDHVVAWSDVRLIVRVVMNEVQVVIYFYLWIISVDGSAGHRREIKQDSLGLMGYVTIYQPHTCC